MDDGNSESDNSASKVSNNTNKRQRINEKSDDETNLDDSRAFLSITTKCDDNYDVGVGGNVVGASSSLCRLPIWNTTTRRCQRPFPAYQVLVSTVDKHDTYNNETTKEPVRKYCPLIRDFLVSINAVENQQHQQEQQQRQQQALKHGSTESDGRLPVDVSTVNEPPPHEAANNIRTYQQDSSKHDTFTEEDNTISFLIDDTSQSTITVAQHQRYLKLTSQISSNNKNNNNKNLPLLSWKEQTQKDYRNLQNIVTSEQRTYRKALFHFWNLENQTRLSLGFAPTTSSSSNEEQKESKVNNKLITINSFPDLLQEMYNEETEPRGDDGTQVFFPHPKRYSHRSCQEISLYAFDTPVILSESSILDSISTRFLDERTCTRCDKSGDNESNESSQPYRGIAIIRESEMLSRTGEIPVPCVDMILEAFRLENESLIHDVRARELAVEHNAAVITTDKTLACMLQNPAIASWTIPLCHKTTDNGRSIIILDPPLPRNFSSPRDCLTEGFRESIYQLLESSCRTARGEHDNHCRPSSKHPDVLNATVDCGTEPIRSGRYRYKYVMLSFPSTRTGRKIDKYFRVIVRVCDRLAIDSPATALSIHVNLEYFPERGFEISPASDRAKWILDHILRPQFPPHLSRTVMTCVDPNTASLLSWKNVGIAHAMTGNSEFTQAVLATDEKNEQKCADDTMAFWQENPIELWNILIHLLQSVPTVGKGHHLLCFPARGTERSADYLCRKSVSVHKPDPTNGVIGICNDIKEETMSYLGFDSFWRCFRPWKWEKADRVPYTFPVPSIDGMMQNKKKRRTEAGLRHT